MIKLAKISEIDNQKVVVNLQQSQECSDCKSRCSDGFLNFLFKNNNNEIVVALNDTKLSGTFITDAESFFTSENKIDDVIGLKFNETQLFRLSFLLYGLPILLIVIALIFGVLLFENMGLNADLGGVLGLVLGLLISKLVINKFKSMPKVTFFK